LTLLQEAGYSRDKIKLLVNRTGKRTEVPNDDLAAALGYPIYAEIPDDRGIAHSITVGMPIIMSDMKSPAARAYLDLGRRLAGVPGKQRQGVFGGLRLRRGPDSESAPVPPAPHPVTAGGLLDAWAPVIGAADRHELASDDLLERQLDHSWHLDQPTAPLIRAFTAPVAGTGNGRVPSLAPAPGNADGSVPAHVPPGALDE
jgi:hypothetical protein